MLVKNTQVIKLAVKYQFVLQCRIPKSYYTVVVIYLLTVRLQSIYVMRLNKFNSNKRISMNCTKSIAERDRNSRKRNWFVLQLIENNVALAVHFCINRVNCVMLSWTFIELTFIDSN